jgi:hypothetical protein
MFPVESTQAYRLAPGVYCINHSPSERATKYLIHERLPEDGVLKTDDTLIVYVERGVLFVFMSQTDGNIFLGETLYQGEQLTIPPQTDYYLIGRLDRGLGTLLHIRTPE